MPELIDVRRGAYYDSVTLMQVSKRVAGTPGITAAQVAMGTDLNREVLGTMGFTLPDGIGVNDVIVALQGSSSEALDAAVAAVDDALAELRSRSQNSIGFGSAPEPVTLGGAIAAAEANLALISVPGEYAALEARAALEKGLALDPVAVEGHYALARIALFEGQFDEATTHLNAVKAINISMFPDVPALLERAKKGEKLERVNR